MVDRIVGLGSREQKTWEPFRNDRFIRRLPLFVIKHRVQYKIGASKVCPVNSEMKS